LVLTINLKKDFGVRGTLVPLIFLYIDYEYSDFIKIKDVLLGKR